MAKNMLKKKQRIAHFKTLNEEHNMYSPCDDFLSTIIEGMDKNDLLSVMDFNKFDSNFTESNTTSVEKKTPIPKQNPQCIQKSKNFGLSRKFPLMEKSQRALKQIIHNRKMPKPMAHLAGLSTNSSLENNQQSLDTSLISEKSKKNKLVVKNSNKFQNNKVTEKLSCHRVKSQVSTVKKNTSEKSSVKVTHKNHELPKTNRNSSDKKEYSNLVSTSKNTKPPVTNKSSFKESFHLEKNEYDKTGSTDSEDYEKFIQKEKKMLSKKPKNHKDTRRKQNVSKKVSKICASRKANCIRMVVSQTDSESDEQSTSYYKNKRIKSSHKVLNKPSNTSLEDSESEMDAINDDAMCSKKHASKTKSKTVVSESDEEPYYKNKRIKRNHKVLKPSNTSLEDSESEMDVINDDAYYHNSSSDSDELLPLSAIADNLQSNSSKNDSSRPRQIDAKHDSTSELNSSCETSANTLISHDQSNDSISPKMPDISSVSNVQLSVPHETSAVASLKENVQLASAIPISKVDHSNILHKTSGSQNLSVSCSVAKNDSVLSNSSKHEKSNNSLIVDLTESDHEEQNSVSVMPKIVTTSSQIQSDSSECSEESDIELVDVVVPPDYLKKSLDKNVAPNISNNDTSKLNIKTEGVNHIPPTSQNNFKPSNELHTSLTTNMQSKGEIAHATNLNQGYCKNEIKDTVKQFNNLPSSKNEIKDTVKQFNNLPSSKSNNEECSFALKVKKEPEPCDIEIILDTSSSSNSIQNLPIEQGGNTSVKTEKDSKLVKQTSGVPNVEGNCTATVTSKKLLEKEQKLHEVACSNLKNLMDVNSASLASLEEENMSEMHSIDIKTALQNLKKEFATYQEILQTEQSVGATFKMLEKCQAEKLKSLRTQITKCLDSGNIDGFDSIKNAMSKMLSNSEIASARCFGDSVPKSDILVSGNLVPRSSIPSKDIKPDLAELQHTIKKENMSFGQKCAVCAKAAAAACERCAKVFFCSNECGKKYWEDGHRDSCKIRS